MNERLARPGDMSHEEEEPETMYERNWNVLKQWAEDQPAYMNVSPVDILNRMTRLENGDPVDNDQRTKPISMSAEREAFEIVQAIRDLLIEEQAKQGGHVHQWVVVGVRTPQKEIHPRLLEQVQTYALLRCRDCNWLMSIGLAGYWTEDQIKGVLDAGSDTPSN